ncbi:response regulator [Oscillatoria sp. FACHB-1407]|uniref:hybrid sensor histidine kinase/response regulator n=1 Tax=Oscillatoria sp. FACHB-1407 TaxID=2692847 RepID=UPI00168A281B|nr:response regulator [Oscillatoria sp. FACHB-1407]MBD2461911.1 response regulator [Oscillatoria sp. FACHB-1407]
MVSSASILIVDDTPTNLKVLVEAFEQVGFDSFVAKTGESALKKARQNTPDLVLLDICMNGMDGFETCQALKADPLTSSIPIIFMTALSDEATKVRGFEAGAVDYITKPVQLREAIARISVHLQLKHSHQKLLDEIKMREETGRQLQKTLHRLQQTQVQLIQAEKLAGLGQMMAGIAHEINNPINFIHGNLEHLQGYTDNLLKVINLYTKYYPDPPKEIQQLMAAIDWDFIQSDLPDLISSIQAGTSRTQEIIQSLQIFSRTGSSLSREMNIHEGINNTLLLLGHRLSESATRPKIELIKDFQLTPLVECFPGFLNQVFMNLIANAIDAIDEKALAPESYQTEAPAIVLSTYQSDAQSVVIEVKDNGIGVSDSILEKVFDPFFTTKPVGKGTGLGLSICHEIITNRHHGTIQCQSSSNGSVFRITIPLSQSNIDQRELCNQE